MLASPKRHRVLTLSLALDPKTAFYDWLYLYALKEHAEFLKRLFKYYAFSDIEFNPEKSLNTQARSCALLVALLRRHVFPKAVYDRDLFIDLLKHHSSEYHRSELPDQTRLL